MNRMCKSCLFIFSIIATVAWGQKVLDRCNMKILWRAPKTLSSSLIKRVKKLIKQAGHPNNKKRERAKSFLRKLAPNTIRYLKSYRWYNLNAEQQEALKFYPYINLSKINTIRVICVKEDKVVWLASFYAGSAFQFIVIGGNNKIIDSFIISARWQITNYGCNILEEGTIQYAVEIKLDRVVAKNVTIEVDGVITSKKALSHASLYTNPSRTAYLIIYITPNGKFRIVTHTNEFKEYDEIKGPVFFSPNGKRTAFIAQKNEKWVVIIDGKESAQYDEIIEPVIFTPDSKKVGFIAVKENKWVSVINDIETTHEFYSVIHSPKFTADGEKISFVALKIAQWVIVLNSKEITPPTNTQIPFFTISQDGNRIGFLSRNGLKWSAVIDGKQSQQYDDILELSFSQDSKRVGYVARRGKKWMAVIDGKESLPYDEIHSFTFSPDSKKAAFIAKKAQRWIAVVNSNESKEYHEITDKKLTFTKNSKFFIFTGSNHITQKDELVINNKIILTAKKLSNIEILDNTFLVVGYHSSNKIFLLKCNLN
jgi:hypothetical protein